MSQLVIIPESDFVCRSNALLLLRPGVAATGSDLMPCDRSNQALSIEDISIKVMPEG